MSFNLNRLPGVCAIQGSFLHWQVTLWIKKYAFIFPSVLYQYRLVPNLLEFSSKFLPLEDLELPLGKRHCDYLRNPCLVN